MSLRLYLVNLTHISIFTFMDNHSFHYLLSLMNKDVSIFKHDETSLLPWEGRFINSRLSILSI